MKVKNENKSILVTMRFFMFFCGKDLEDFSVVYLY